jgi:hypothetical protein
MEQVPRQNSMAAAAEFWPLRHNATEQQPNRNGREKAHMTQKMKRRQTERPTEAMDSAHPILIGLFLRHLRLFAAKLGVWSGPLFSCLTKSI